MQYFSFLRSLWFDRDVSFENEYQHFYDAGVARDYNFHETFLERTTETGRRVSFATVGSALLWAPFYAVADAGVLLARAGGSAIPRDGYAWPYVAAVVLRVRDLWRSRHCCCRSVRREQSGSARRRAFLRRSPSGSARRSSSIRTSRQPMAHATAAFAVALFVVVWLHVRERWTLAGGLALGAAGALMVMVREQDVTFFAAPAIDLAMRVLKNPQQWLRPALRAAGRRRARVRREFPAAGCGISRPERAYRTVTARQPEDELADASRLGHPGLAGARVLPVDAAGACRARRACWSWRPGCGADNPGTATPRCRSAVRAASLPACVRRSWRRCICCGALDSWTSAGAFGQRRFVSSTILLVIGLATIFSMMQRLPDSAPGSRFRRRADLVEPRADGASSRHSLMDRQRLELEQECLRCIRDGPVAWRPARLSLPLRSLILLPGSGRSTTALLTLVRILYFADIRFPLERANGIQTMETCHALAGRGHSVHLVVRPDTSTPARDPFAYYGLRRATRLDDRTGAGRAGPPSRDAIGYLAFAIGRASARARADVVMTRDLGGRVARSLHLPALRPPLVYESHGYAPDVAAALPDAGRDRDRAERAKLRAAGAARSARLAARRRLCHDHRRRWPTT